MNVQLTKVIKDISDYTRMQIMLASDDGQHDPIQLAQY